MKILRCREKNHVSEKSSRQERGVLNLKNVSVYEGQIRAGKMTYLLRGVFATTFQVMGVDFVAAYFPCFLPPFSSAHVCCRRLFLPPEPPADEGTCRVDVPLSLFSSNKRH